MMMLRWTILFLIIAFISAMFAFTGMIGNGKGAAEIAFYVFLILSFVPLLLDRR